MFALTLKNLAAHKARLVSTALAVVLGVAFMAGTLVFNDTLTATFDNVVAEANDGVDALVRAPSPVDLAYGQSGSRIDPSIAHAVATVDGVDDVAYQIFGYAQLVGPDGKAIGDQEQAPALGLNWVDNVDMNPYRIVEGTPPAVDGHVVIDRKSARESGYGPGDTVTVLTSTAPRKFTVSGVATFAGADSVAGATSILFTDTTAMQLLSPDGGVDGIVVAADDGVSQDDLVARVSSVVSSDIEVVSGDQVVAEDQAAFGEMLQGFKVFMLVFAFVALFVGAFIINNTFSITVAQRTKEMAMLRAVGASRRQVLGSVITEAMTIGVIASAAGLAVGIGVAQGLRSMLGGFGLEMPDGPTVVTANSMLIALITGVSVTVLSAVLPARRGSRVKPIAALRDLSVDRSSASKSRGISGSVLLGAGLLALFAGLGGSGIALVGTGAFLTLVAVAVLAPIIARPVTGALGRPLGWTGVSGEMATRNAQRSAKRTGRTASALMIGVALVSFITVLGASFNSSFASAIDHDYHGTHVIDSGAYEGRGGISLELAAALRRTPGVDTVTATRMTPAVVDGSDEPMFEAFDPTIGTLFDLGDIEGDLATLGVDGIAVSQDRAETNGWTLGSTITVGLPTGEHDFVVRAIYEDATWVGNQFVSTAAFDQFMPAQLDFRVYLAGDDAVVREVAAPYSSGEVQDRKEFGDRVSADINQILGIVYALLGLAVVISLFGIANTLALSVYERTRELGLLRAVGMSRRQVRATIRGEAVVIAVFGTVLGLGVGVFFGWATIRALADQGIDTLTIPTTTLALIALGGALAAGVAASVPARRAARLDVLSALSTQ
jgi:putative ABC transport system permease protein